MNLRLTMLSVAFGIGVAQPAWSQKYSLHCEFNHGLGITKYQYIFKGSGITLGKIIDVKRQINEKGYPPGKWETDPSVEIKSEGPYYFMADSKD